MQIKQKKSNIQKAIRPVPENDSDMDTELHQINKELF